MRPNGTLRVPVRLSGLTAGEEARIVVAAVDVGILNLTNYKPPSPDDYLSRPAPAHGGDPRPLRPTARRHAGHARRDPHRRRRGGGCAWRHAADAAAARALFRHRQREVRRHRGSAVRHSGLRRHRARDGGRVVEGQGRPRLRRRDRARSGRADRDLAALPAHRRPRHASGSISTMSKVRPATTRSACRPTVRSRSGRRSRRSASPASSAPASACRSARPRSASAMWRSASAGRTASTCSAATRSPPSPRRRC